MMEFPVVPRRAGKTTMRKMIADIEAKHEARFRARNEARLPQEFEVVQEIYEFGSYEPVEVIRRCVHVNQTPVQTVDDVVVAYLCLDCDAQIDVGDF